MFPAASPESPPDSNPSIPDQAAPPAYCLQVLDGQVPFGIWVCDREGGVVYLSASFLDLLGMDLQECRVKGWVGRLSAEEAETTSARWKICLRSGDAWEHQFDLMGADGVVRHILSRGVPVRDGEGGATSWVGMHLDIGGIRESEEELRQSQERFRVALESGCDLLYEFEPVTCVRRWFGPVDKQLGFANEEFPRTQAAWEAILHPDDREAVLHAHARALEGRSPFHLEYRVKRKDGEVMYWLDRGKAMRDKDGKPLLWIGFVTDMTDHRRAEEMLRKSEERRRISQRLEVIGRLAGGIAHDFNNLLTAINGYSELVLGELGPDSPIASHVSEILRAGEKAAMLTRQLLAFSRRQVISPKLVDVNDILTEMRKLLAEFLGKDVRISFRQDPQLAKIRADPSQVEQALLNLALNAKDAMPHGGELIVSTENMEIGPGELPGDSLEGEARPGPYVLLSIRDTGTGMDEETQAHLFEPFFTTKGRAQGLGLSAVYGIMKQGGGHIQVTSRKGHGTRLNLYWPKAETGLRPGSGQASAGASEPGREDAGSGPAPAGRKPTVLMAEDDGVQRIVIQEMLENHGFSVLVAGSGKEALDIVQRQSESIDLLLADVIMPGMDGLELAYALGSIRPGIKVLFMSGYTDYRQVREGVLESQLDFIGKPFTARELADKIGAVLSMNRVA